MIKRLLFFTFCMLALMANAQDVTITGSVTDVNQEPLLGVNIKLKGTTTGVVSDMDGNFSIKGPKGATLIFSYIRRSCLTASR